MSTPPWSIIRAMSREDSQFKLRMPAHLREQVELASQESKRSLNAEIVARLEESFRPQAGAAATVGEVMDLLMQLCAKAGRPITITFGDAEDGDGED